MLRHGARCGVVPGLNQGDYARLLGCNLPDGLSRKPHTEALDLSRNAAAAAAVDSVSPQRLAHRDYPPRYHPLGSGQSHSGDTERSPVPKGS